MTRLPTTAICYIKVIDFLWKARLACSVSEISRLEAGVWKAKPPCSTSKASTRRPCFKSRRYRPRDLVMRTAASDVTWIRTFSISLHLTLCSLLFRPFILLSPHALKLDYGLLNYLYPNYVDLFLSSSPLLISYLSRSVSLFPSNFNPALQLLLLRTFLVR
ncbi:hypothetical protein BDR04DRAFT_702374 [Suillus decipiens]|nr:hypothetical protein BDR04DRAFT_702374 [Suillus decipiens]